MHELLLFAQIPAAQQRHVLQILSGIAAAQPSPLLEHHLVFAPARPAGPVPRPTGAIPISDRYYLQLVGDLSSAEGFREGTEEGTKGSRRAASGDASASKGSEEEHEINIWDACPWSLDFCDQPDPPGRRLATSRAVSSLPMVEGNRVQGVEALGYA